MGRPEGDEAETKSVKSAKTDKADETQRAPSQNSVAQSVTSARKAPTPNPLKVRTVLLKKSK